MDTLHLLNALIRDVRHSCACPVHYYSKNRCICSMHSICFVIPHEWRFLCCTCSAHSTHITAIVTARDALQVDVAFIQRTLHQQAKGANSCAYTAHCNFWYGILLLRLLDALQNFPYSYFALDLRTVNYFFRLAHITAQSADLDVTSNASP